MIRRLIAFAFTLAATGAMAQNMAPNRFGSNGGFGSVLYPGVGHAPVNTPGSLGGFGSILYPGTGRPVGNISDPTFANRFGASVRGFGPGYGGVQRGAPHPAHGRQVIVPVPIVVGGGYYPMDPGYYQDPSMAAPPVALQPQQPVTPPVIIINQAYRPESAAPVVREYIDEDSLPQAVQGSPGLKKYDAPTYPMPDPKETRPDRPARRTGAAVQDDPATIYLIAFKDHTILPALAYWVEDDTLNYITTQGTPNRASLTLIDREFSRQLNRERKVEFSLP
jgi:hypothetical protein